MGMGESRGGTLYVPSLKSSHPAVPLTRPQGLICCRVLYCLSGGFPLSGLVSDMNGDGVLCSRFSRKSHHGVVLDPAQRELGDAAIQIEVC